MSESEIDFDEQREFVRAVLAREVVAIEAFSKRMRCIPKFVRILARRSGRVLSPDDASDIAQDAMVAVLESLERFESRAPLEAWVFRICDFTMRTRSRAQQRRSSVIEIGGEIEAEAPDGANELEARERVDDCLRDVGGVEAEVLRLKHCEDLSFPEIAQRLEQPLGTMKSYYYRGLERVRARLQRRKV